MGSRLTTQRALAPADEAANAPAAVAEGGAAAAAPVDDGDITETNVLRICPLMDLDDPTEFVPAAAGPLAWSYGDGGECDVEWHRVFVCGRALTSRDTGKLAAEIGRLAARRGDVQDNLIVEDVVDPDLCPRFLPLSERKVYRTVKDTATARVGAANAAARGSYQWLPSRVEWRGGAGGLDWAAARPRALFSSPIHNLPRTAANAALYTLLEDALTALLPAMVKANPDTLGDKRRFNVVTKLQRYVVPPGAAYTGKWHTEGVTENVAAVGVMYVAWPAALRGGALRFRPTSVPDATYREWRRGGASSALTLVVEAGEGTALAFPNIPHRFMTLTNPTDRPLERAFLNFFIVDDALPTTAEVPTRADVYLALGRKTNFHVVQDVLDFLGLPPTWDAAQRVRRKAKAEMVAMRGKWGQMNHGNCGTVSWLPTNPLACRQSPPPKGDDDGDDVDWHEDDDEDYRENADLEPAGRWTAAKAAAMPPMTWRRYHQHEMRVASYGVDSSRGAPSLGSGA